MLDDKTKVRYLTPTIVYVLGYIIFWNSLINFYDSVLHIELRIKKWREPLTVLFEYVKWL